MGIKPRLRSKMTHYEDLRDQPTKWLKKLVQMDIAQAEQTQNSKNQPAKRACSDRSPTDRSTQRSSEIQPEVTTDTINKRKKENRCLKCGKTGNRIADCQSIRYRQTPPPSNPPKPSTGNLPKSSDFSAPAAKKSRTDTGTLRITQLDSLREKTKGFDQFDRPNP